MEGYCLSDYARYMYRNTGFFPCTYIVALRVSYYAYVTILNVIRLDVYFDVILQTWSN